MKQKYLMLLLIMAMVLSFTLPSQAASKGKSTPQPAAAQSTSAADNCLKCHGPFEKLISVSPEFVMKSGEKVKPHRYVPHDLKEIPDCLSCHKKHSATPTKSELAALPKANVQTCFSCHHTENFTNCKSCHNGK
jgi:hypothetical protein